MLRTSLPWRGFEHLDAAAHLLQALDHSPNRLPCLTRLQPVRSHLRSRSRRPHHPRRRCRLLSGVYLSCELSYKPIRRCSKYSVWKTHFACPFVFGAAFRFAAAFRSAGSERSARAFP